MLGSGVWTHLKAVMAAVSEARGEGVVDELGILDKAVKDFRMIAFRRASLL